MVTLKKNGLEQKVPKFRVPGYLSNGWTYADEEMASPEDYFKKQLSELEKENDELEAENDTLRKDNDALKKSIEERDAEIAKLKQATKSKQ